jgi:hypothetical protein
VPSTGTDTPTERQHVLQSDTIIDAVLKLIREKLPSLNSQDALSISGAFEEGQVKAEVTLHYKGRSKKGSPLDKIFNSVRSAPDLDYEASRARKERVSSKVSKLSRQYSVRMNGKVPDPSSVFDKMKEMLNDLVAKRAVLADP